MRRLIRVLWKVPSRLGSRYTLLTNSRVTFNCFFLKICFKVLLSKCNTVSYIYIDTHDNSNNKSLKMMSPEPMVNNCGLYL